MRVLIIGLNYAPEPIGIGPYTAGLAEWLAARGHEVAVIAGNPYYPQWRSYAGFGGWWRRSAEKGVRIVRCPHYVPARPSGARRIVHHLSFAAAALAPALWRALRLRPEVVICVTPSLVSAATAWIAAKMARARLWLHVQDFEVDAAVATGLVSGRAPARLLARIERALLRSADTVSSISPKMIERLHAKGVEPARTFELRNWANPDFRAPAGAGESYRGEWGLKRCTVALYSGSLGRKQGAGVIVEAARLTAARGDIAFVVCGEGPERAELEARARGLASIRFHDLQPAARMGELLALADVHLLPQIAEAADLMLPSKLTNMLLSGRPVIATAAPGTGIADEIAGCGIAIPPGDAAALAAAVVRIADDPALAATLGAEAARRAEQRWSQASILGAMERRLTQLALASARPGP